MYLRIDGTYIYVMPRDRHVGKGKRATVRYLNVFCFGRDSGLSRGEKNGMA